MSGVFPFTAIVGQELMKQALILNAVNPLIGGVLIRGEKGTAKSTLARALAELLPEIPVVPGCPFHCDPAAPFRDCPHCATTTEHAIEMHRMRVVTLPANATEDRVAGTLNVEHALKHAERRFEPGVLAEAHRGILYIDEVNLLDDHIIDLLLDAAAMGVNTVEREGISFSHPARFMLIGTMNPEEGDLRPQLLDRFSLCVDASALMDKDTRAEIIRRRIAWERDGTLFAAGFADQQRQLQAAIAAARALLPQVTVDDERLEDAARICIQLDVRSHRADIVMVRTAMTIAAYAARTEVSRDDIRQAALLSLPHRMRKRPFEESRLDPDKIEQALDPRDKHSSVSSTAADAPVPAPHETQTETTFESAAMPEITLPLPTDGNRWHSATGRKSPATASARRGRYARSALPDGPVAGSDIAIDATLRAAAPHQNNRKPAEAICIAPEHLRIKRRKSPARTTILFVVDASGSMAAAARMAAAKGAVLNLLRDAYVKRQRVALLAFRDAGAEVLLPPTDNVDLAHEQLQNLPTGGRTPLAHGLAKALELVQHIRQATPDTLLMIVLISDGRANVPYGSGPQTTPFDEAVDFARQLVLLGTVVVVLDTEDDFLPLGFARKLASAAGAEYLKLSRIEEGAIENAVRGQLQQRQHSKR